VKLIAAILSPKQGVSNIVNCHDDAAERAGLITLSKLGKELAAPGGACFETRRGALLSMRYLLDCIEKALILRKPLSGCLEGRTVRVPAA
jgi:hypothetical protein